MANGEVFEFLTAKGVADKGQDGLVAELKAQLAQPGAKLLLHLHGGLVDERAGKAIADRLSGIGEHAFNAGADWTQVYVIWRTGVFEVVKEHWIDLLKSDKLYRALVRKLISFVAQRLSLPAFDGREATQEFPLSDAEILQRMLGQRDTREPFADVDEHLASVRDTRARALVAPNRSSGDLVLEFGEYLREDDLFQSALADLDAAVNADVPERAASGTGSAARGAAMIERLDKKVSVEIEPAPAVDSEAERGAETQRGLVHVGITVVQHALKVALRVIERFRKHRDHGLHATIVEEVCREFYADYIGAWMWAQMVGDAARHFEEGGFGLTLLEALPDDPEFTIAVTAHSAGAIWASRLLQAMERNNSKHRINLCLLAPAVRDDLFAETVAASSSRIARCHMFTMCDELERRDGVLGHDLGYIYPSSLLYLVSGLFETLDSKDYVDAPLVGMQRFVGAPWLNAAEIANGVAISQFFSHPGKAISYSKDSLTDADSHGGFDDNPLTLKSVKAEFLA